MSDRRLEPDRVDPVQAAIADLATRLLTGDEPTEPIEVAQVQTRVLLRRGDRVWTYATGPDGIPRLLPSDEKDGGRDMVRPPRMDI